MKKVLLWLLLCTGIGSHADLHPDQLRCEYRTDPLGIDEVQPRLSWMVRSGERAQRQTAYRILVASSRDLLDAHRGDLWDSGKVDSDQTLHVPYQGKPLTSRQACFWKVKVWDGRDQSSAWGPAGVWTMGLLDPSDWSARYISYRDTTPVHTDTDSLFLPAARQYRKTFPTGKPVRRATLYSTGLGIYELYLNGQRVSDTFFMPGWTDYHQRAYYLTHDVTDQVQRGANALGAWVADGWYSGYVGFGLLVGIGTERIGRYTYGKTPCVQLQLEIEYEDGTRDTVSTDTTWQVTGDGPIQEADFLMGERYDARREMDGWATASFDDAAWESAVLAEDNGHPEATFYEFRNPDRPGVGPKIEGRAIDLGFKAPPRIEAFPGEPVRITEEIKTVEWTPRGEGTFIANLGQNFAGTVRLKVQGSAGHEITLRYGEMLHPDGRLMTENLRRARATDRYVCKGSPGGEVFMPRFTFHGFQYVELSNFPGTPTSDTLTGLALHSDTPLTSTFACSDPVVNKLFENVVWTQRANFLDLPTDCPQRDERMGWTGDAQAYIGTSVYNADVGAFYTKWIRELMESQRPSGTFPGYAPFPFQHGWDFGSAWADAGIICPWTIWQAYGDTRIIARCWEPMTRFMDWRKQTSRDELGIAHGNRWGDWLAQGAETPLDYIDSVYFALTSRMMAEMAEAVDKAPEAAAYQQQFDRTKTAFRKKYLQADGQLTVSTQTAYALALFANLVPEDQRDAVGQHLADMIARNGQRMSTGFLGTRPLLPVLSSVGRHDLAVFLLQSRAFPSWGYEVEQGATSIWERWDSYTKEDGFGRHNAAMNSFSHYSFGAVCEWMFNTLAGIRSDSPGYERIVIHPGPPAPGSNAERTPIDWVDASYDSMRGRIRSRWKQDGDLFHLETEIPANTRAAVFLPAARAADIREAGKPLDQAEGVRFVGMQGSRAQLDVGSGHYQFTVPGGLPAAAVALRISEPEDRSINPDDIDLSGAKQVAHWDFRNPGTAAAWGDRNHLEFENRNGKVFLVGTGADPQLAVVLSRPLTGKLVLALTARPAKNSSVQFFWASAQGGYNEGQSNSRTLQGTDQTHAYLFHVGDAGPLQKIRFDPFPNQGELEIETIRLYRLK